MENSYHFIASLGLLALAGAAAALLLRNRGKLAPVPVRIKNSKKKGK
jgi:hypothetical protein